MHKKEDRRRIEQGEKAALTSNKEAKTSKKKAQSQITQGEDPGYLAGGF